MVARSFLNTSILEMQPCSEALKRVLEELASCHEADLEYNTLVSEEVFLPKMSALHSENQESIRKDAGLQ